MAFICEECGRTWPYKDNQDPAYDYDPGSLEGRPDTGICPDCYDGDESDDDDEEDFESRIAGAYGYVGNPA